MSFSLKAAGSEDPAACIASMINAAAPAGEKGEVGSKSPPAASLVSSQHRAVGTRVLTGGAFDFVTQVFLQRRADHAVWEVERIKRPVSRAAQMIPAPPWST